MSARDKIAKTLMGAVAPPPKQYLRIGDWHPSEMSRNYSKGDIEAGVSVYDMHPTTGRPIAPPEGEWAETDMLDRLRSAAPKYIVEGEQVGTGHEGEALLQKLRIIKNWGEQ